MSFTASRENLSSEFPTRSDTNQTVQPQKMATRLEISDLESRVSVLSMQRKYLKLICAFVLAYTKSRLSHDESQ